MKNNNLILKIEENQEPWCPEFDDKVIVSSIQTGLFAGGLGTKVGQHRFNDACVVQEEQEPLRLCTPTYGYFEVRAKGKISANNLITLWMIGYEDEPYRSAEICIFEIFGDKVEKNTIEIGYGLHPFGDPNINDEFYKETFNLDIAEFHTFGVHWTPDFIDFFVDSEVIRKINQSPDYPMQFMLGIYEFARNETPNKSSEKYPKEFFIDYFKVYKKRN
ncbi:MAG: glycoside hydrolase family 16 protein [Candidatus Thorarchaeota archaeon]